jgi:DNA-binding transcriptional ArsR family regulator
MARLESSKSSPSGELASERLIDAVFAPDRYPEGATFIGAEEDHFPTVLAEAVAELQPLVIVYADGHELIGQPRDGVLAFRRRVSSPTLDPDLIKKAFGHPVRISVLSILLRRLASPTELARELNEPLGVTAYHVNSLAEAGLIRSVETKQNRAAVEHLYELVPAYRQEVEEARIARKADHDVES